MYGDRAGALTRPGTALLWTTVVSGVATASIGWIDSVIALSALSAIDGFAVMTQASLA